MLSDVSQSEKDKYSMQIPHDSTYMRLSKIVQLIEIENKMVVARGYREKRSCYSIGIELQVCKMKTF